MQKGFLIIGLLLALALGACGEEGSSDSSGGSDAREFAPFRISTATPPIRYARDMKIDANGLSGKELKPIIPDSPPPEYLVVHDLIEGIAGGRYGDVAGPGDEVEVQYAGYDYETEKKFASSWDQGKPFVFTLGKGEVIEGWEQGLLDLEAGDRRELVIPPELTSGGSRMSAPQGRALVYVVEGLRGD